MHTCLKQAGAASVAEAARLLRAGEVVGIPTETVYGLAANALSDEAVPKIFAAKGRPQDNPLISHIASLDMLPMVVREVPGAAYRLAEAFWPGPLTLILPRSKTVADSVCAGLDTGSVGMPSHPVALAVIRAAGVPLAAPSANLSGSPSPTTAADVLADMEGKIPLILDGGACSVGVESTVISLAGAQPVLLRPGYITKEQLEDAMGCAVALSDAVLHKLKDGESAASPGMKYKHYAPKADVTILKGSFDAYKEYMKSHCADGVYALCFTGEEPALPCPCVTYGRADKPDEQAHALFSALRELDARGAKTVFARCPAQEGVAMAVYNRLLRAAAFRVVSLGYPVLDADRTAREVTRPGGPCLAQLCDAFGSDILLPDGTLDRGCLAARAFATPEGTRRLTDITHPAIIRELLDSVAAAQSTGVPFVFVDGAVIVGEAFEQYCDAIIVVTAPEREAVSRIVLRDGISKQAARMRLAAQTPEDVLRAAADYIIANTGDGRHLRAAAQAVLERLLAKETNGTKEKT